MDALLDEFLKHRVSNCSLQIKLVPALQGLPFLILEVR